MSPRRLTKLVPASLSEEQAALYERIAGGPRTQMGVSLADEEGGLIGPFNAYLHSPALGGHLEAAGVGLRELTALAPKLREIAILVSARHHRAQFEWYAHARIGEAEGISPAAIEAMRLGCDPGFEDEAEAAVFRFSGELLGNHRLSDAAWDGAAA